MAFSFVWDASFKAAPADTDNASQGASRIRDLKNAISERLVVDHSLAGDASDGMHTHITFVQQGADPATVALTGYLYTKNVAGATEVFYKDAAGNIQQLTSAGKLNHALLADSATSAGTVTTNANLTGPITSTGNATAVASQTGTGTKFVMDTSPTLVTPTLGIASATSLTATSDIVTSGGKFGYSGTIISTDGQLTSKSTAVASSGGSPAGGVLTNNAALAAGAIVSFNITGVLVGSNHVVIINHVSGGTIGAYTVNAHNSTNNTITVTLRNNTAGSLSEALDLEYCVINR